MYRYEISVCLRDSLGNLVRDNEGRVKKKTFSTDQAGEIADFYNRNSYKKKKVKKNAKNNEATS